MTPEYAEAATKMIWLFLCGDATVDYREHIGPCLLWEMISVTCAVSMIIND